MKHIETWLRTAQPGNRFVYYEGFLARDRLSLGAGGTGIRNAKKAMELAADGVVHLIQNRVGKLHWEYIAIRTKSALVNRPDFTPSKQKQKLTIGI